MKRSARVGFLWILAGVSWAGAGAAAPGEVVSGFAAPGDSPSGLGWDGTHLWIANLATAQGGEDELTRHDAATGVEVSALPMPPGRYLHGIAFDSPTTFFADDLYTDLVHLDSAGSVLSSFGAQGMTYGVAFDPTSARLFQADWTTATLHELTTGGALVGSVALALDAEAMLGGLAWDGIALWTVGITTETIYRVSPSDGAVLTSFAAPGPGPEGIAWDGACLWISDTSTDLVQRVDHGVPSLPLCPDEPGGTTASATTATGAGATTGSGPSGVGATTGSATGSGGPSSSSATGGAPGDGDGGAGGADSAEEDAEYEYGSPMCSCAAPGAPTEGWIPGLLGLVAALAGRRARRSAVSPRRRG